MVKHKYKYSCESAIYFNLDSDIIKRNCKFDFYFNKTDVKLSVVNGGHEIILANWPNDKHIVYTINNDIPVNIPSFPYILPNRSVLCNCDIEAENNFLLESITVCHDAKSDLVMYLTVNSVFVNYFDDLIDSLDVPTLQNWTTNEQILPISLQSFEFNQDLLQASKTLKEFMNQYYHKKRNF